MAAVVVEVDALRVDEIVLFEDFEQFVTAHLPGVASVETEDAQELCPLAVLGRGDLLEVGERPTAAKIFSTFSFNSVSTLAWTTELLFILIPPIFILCKLYHNICNLSMIFLFL